MGTAVTQAVNPNDVGGFPGDLLAHSAAGASSGADSILNVQNGGAVVGSGHPSLTNIDNRLGIGQPLHDSGLVQPINDLKAMVEALGIKYTLLREDMVTKQRQVDEVQRTIDDTNQYLQLLGPPPPTAAP